MALISIIVPIYKVESYLRRCVDSILAQTFTDFELILVDDGSPDGCPAICDEYAAKDPRVRVIHKENGGLSSARNTGLDAAKGEYIGFIDSDDYIHPQMYEILLTLIEKTNADISACHYQFVEPEQNIDHSTYHIDSIDNITQIDCKAFLERLSENRSRVSLVSACMRLCKKHLYDNLRFMEGFTEEDSLILPYLLERANLIARVKLPLYYWTVRQNSISRVQFSSQRFSFVMVSYTWAVYFRAKSIPQQAAYFQKEFLNRCIEYSLKAKKHGLQKDYRPYRKLYRQNLWKYCFTSGLCKAEYLLHFCFLLKLPFTERIYLKLFPDKEL